MAGSDASKAAAKKPSPLTPKRIAIGVSLLIALILILTNFGKVEVNLFMAHIEMPLSLMLAVMFGLGWFAAALTAKLRGGKG